MAKKMLVCKISLLLLLVLAVFLILLRKNTPDKEECLHAKDRFDCYESYYKKIVESKGVGLAVMDLKSEYANNSFIRSQCHQMMHIIGRAAADSQKNVSKAFMEGDPFCWSGYYHGVMEGTLMDYEIKSIPGKINEICKDVTGKKQYSFDYYNCAHGLGHGIMYINNHEVFDSLKICDYLNGSYEQSSCWGGVFMENVMVNFKDHFTKYLKPEDPLYPCDAVDAKYKATCYLMQTSYMLKVTAGNFSKVFQLCSKIGDKYRDSCYQSIGRDASGTSLSNPQATKEKCALGKNQRQQSNCIIGAVKDFISYFHSDKQANEFCSILKPELRQICFETGDSYYKAFN